MADRVMVRDERDGEFETFNSSRYFGWISPIAQLLSALERVSCLHPLAIVPRKRLDITCPDIWRALRLSLEAMVFSSSAGDDAREEASLSASRAWLSLPDDVMTRLVSPVATRHRINPYPIREQTEQNSEQFTHTEAHPVRRCAHLSVYNSVSPSLVSRLSPPPKIRRGEVK